MATEQRNKRSACKIAGLKYPSADNVKNRTSTIARAMACALTPRIPCSPDDEKTWINIFCPDGKDLRCAYCGDKATHLDHLHPLINNLLPTGYGTDPGNLVPCCSKCNQRKGNLDWRVYMNSNLCKHVDNNIQGRIDRIEQLKDDLPPTIINWTEKEGFKEEWERVYKACVKALKEAQDVLEKYKESEKNTIK